MCQVQGSLRFLLLAPSVEDRLALAKVSLHYATTYIILTKVCLSVFMHYFKENGPLFFESLGD